MTTYDGLPPHMREGARLYVEHGIEPGSFLRAILENNFVDAVAKADCYNELALKDWARWLYWELPSNAWGSPGKVNAYMALMRKQTADQT